MNASSYLKEVACAKINLNFKVLKKLPSNYHKIDSFIAFLPQLHDTLLIKKNSKNKIIIKGSQSEELMRLGGDTLITKSINKISAYYKIKINLEVVLNKNIPLGAGLGGGSANAAAIIRAILRNPDILFFDEATANLDTKSINLVSNEIDKFPGTIINITHKPEHFRNANKVYLIEEKNIVEIK